MANPTKVLVSGLINIETTLKIEGFPLGYNPVNYPFFGVQSTVSGVGWNVATALRALGNEPALLSLTGKDPWGALVEAELVQANLPTDGIRRDLAETAQAVILYDPSGRRQIHADLKDIQEKAYPQESFQRAAAGCGLAVLCNINFSRGLLAPAKALGLTIATDVHVLTDIRDPYNADFLAAADIVFLSNEGCLGAEAALAAELLGTYPIAIVVVGMGAQGALLACRNEPVARVPAVTTRPIVNTIGAGDALFSAFVDGHLSGLSPRKALERAVVFASWKIGEKGAAQGFLSGPELARMVP